MKVELINYTPNPEELVAKAGKLCYSSVGVEEIEDKLTEEEIEKFVQHIVNINHESVLEHISFTFAVEGISRACYDKETQVLTYDGWKYFKDIDINKDLFATLNNKGYVEFYKAINKTEYRYKGDMHTYKSQNVDLKITPNHSMYVKKYDTRVEQEYQLIPSENIEVNRLRLNRSFKYEKILQDDVTIKGYSYERKNNQGHLYTVNTDDITLPKTNYIKLLAWYIAEGSVYYNKNENSYTISISQRDEKYKQEIYDVIKSCGMTPTYQESSIRFKSLTLGRFLSQLGYAQEKKIPHNIFDFFNKDLAKLFLLEYEKSDASNDNGHIKYYTTSKQLSEQIGILCHLAGYVSNTWVDDRVGESHYNEKTKNIITHNYPCYVISVSKGNRNSMPIIKRNIHLKKEYYDDMVYCVEVPNHTLFVKRNGLSVWCGNCTHQLVRHRVASFSQQSQRYVRLDQFEYVVPPSIATNPSLDSIFKKQMRESQKAYDLIVDGLIADDKTEKEAIEDARYVFPNACETKIVFTMNARSLLNFLSLRHCRRAQWEIREMSVQILKLIKEVAPNVFKNAGANCISGKCTEGAKSCGQPYKRDNKEDVV